MATQLREGLLVRHPGMPQWGVGKILQLSGSIAKVRFKDDGEQDYRSLSLEHVALQIAEGQQDPVLDNLPPFLGDRFAVTHKRVTIDDGVAAFLRWFPAGFNDDAYLGSHKVGKDTTGERNYKWNAHLAFVDAFGEGRGERRLRGGDLEHLVQDASKIVGKTNMLSPFEMMAFTDGLHASDAAATRFLEALFAFIDAARPEQRRFEALADAVVGLPAASGRAKAATWPVLTILPFLARPDSFMFLKPEPTCACAERLRFEIHYTSELRWMTYSKLMAMSDLLLERLQPLGARDYIDVQSFMWVIAKY